MKTSKTQLKVTACQVCSCFGLTRDAYYKYVKRSNKRLEETEKVLKLVSQRRKEQPREGGKKLHRALQDDFVNNGLKIGRDKLFDILREHNMLVRPKRSFTRTTHSYHHFHRYTNLIKGSVPTEPNQVWVSDITYVRLVRGFCYMALITDVYSRKIVGYDISDSLELAGCLRALQKALRQARPAGPLIHHSDRGVQYCSHQYVRLLKKNGIRISMTEEDHCYENAIAERVNGILKDEFFIDQTFYNLDIAKKACKNAIYVYNTKRLHLSLGYKTPDSMFKWKA
jgi:transposase InsO family protein